MKKICILGANGQLGKELQDAFAKTHFFQVFPTTRKEADVSKLDSLQNFFKKNDFDFVINCAAYTAVDLAEKEIELNDVVNNLGVKNLQAVLKNSASIILHISTDFVFDGTKVLALIEEDITNPLQEYGKSKLKGEQWVERGIIIRTSWLYSIYGNNFLKTMLRLGAEKDNLNVVDNQIGSPTNAADLASAIVEICKDEKVEQKLGLYHFSNEGVASWYDFAVSIMEYAELNCKVSPIPDINYPTPAKRPNFSVMDKTKIKQAFDLEIPYWRSSLKTCINKLT